MAADAATKADADGHHDNIAPQNAAFVENLVRQRLGIELGGKAYLMASRLHRVARVNGLADVNALADRMRAGDRDLADQALDAMTTNETSFFRDGHPFEALASDVLPRLFAARPTGRIRIWNGACSSGQESYSLAIMINETFPHEARSDRVEIFSTDVSPTMVKRTREATYSRFEVNRGMPARLFQKYFDQDGRNWVAKPALRDLVTVREMNLLDRWAGIGTFDIVLLRNVLIYFSNQVKADILGRIRTNVLNPGGCLILGASESTVGVDSGYVGRKVGSTTLYFPQGR